MIRYQILCLIIELFLLLSMRSIECEKVHELMTDDEITSLFHCNRSQIPEYEMVVIGHSFYTGLTFADFIIQLPAFGKDTQVYLNPVDGILVGKDTPVWVAENRNGRTHYRRLKRGIMKEVFKFYQGLINEAALVVRSRKNRDLKFYGTVQDLTVMPLPDRVEQELEETEKSKGNFSRIKCEPTITKHHIIFKSNSDVNQTTASHDLHKYTEKRNEDTLRQNKTGKSKRAGTHTVFPTILVTTDFNVPVETKNRSAYYEQIMYQLAFWNGVDLRFRYLNDPKVRLRIAEIVIGATRSATPYLERNRVDGKVNAFSAHDDMADYWGRTRWNKKFSPEGFHIVATVTNSEMFTTLKSGVTDLVVGMASNSTICIESRYIFYPSAIIRDNLNFGGINIAAHELAHILGADHDDDGDCSSSEGYIMARSRSRTANNFKWSSCSLESIEMTLRLRECTDKPREQYSVGKPLERILPGTIKTAHEQCQGRGYDWACANTPSMCKNLRCYSTGFWNVLRTLARCQTSYSAAEGTECAPRSYCINGECLRLPN